MPTLFNSPLFETVICLILAYALLSLLASSLLELLNSYVQERGKMLYDSISSMFEDGSNVNFGQLIYNSPRIKSFRKDLESLPQYISKEAFSASVIDVISDYRREYEYDDQTKAIRLKEDATPGAQSELFAEGIKKMAQTPLKLQLMNMLGRSGFSTEGASLASNAPTENLSAMKTELEIWYTDQMERTTGWYKASIRWRMLAIGLVVAIALNVDSIHLFQSFYRSPVLRAQLLPIAEKLADNYQLLKQDTTLRDLQRAYRSADSIRVLIKDNPYDSSSVRILNNVLATLNKIDTINQKSDSVRIVLQKQFRSNAEIVASLGLPIGWMKNKAPISWFNSKKRVSNPTDYFERYQQRNFANVVSYLLGILITALSIQFGAPFWFDLLAKAVNIRRAGKKPEESH